MRSWRVCYILPTVFIVCGENMVKKIIIGNVREEFYDSPIKMFQMAVRLSKQEEFIVKSNNPQFIEALEVLCGEDNVEVYFKSSHPYKLKEIDFQTAYNYLGEVYDILNSLRASLFFNREIDDKIEDEIKQYLEKWSEYEW